MKNCPFGMPVHVREYERFRLGKLEHVCQHCRHMPRIG